MSAFANWQRCCDAVPFEPVSRRVGALEWAVDVTEVCLQGHRMGERFSLRTSSGARILLVEDSDDLRTLMVLILEAEGYRVDSARSAEDALRLLCEQRYDLVLSDYALPGHDGVWLLQEAVARELIPTPRGIIVTAHPHVRDAGGFPVLYKPLDFDAFLTAIREHLDRPQQYPSFGYPADRRRTSRRHES